MRPEGLLRFVTVVVALHVAVLSILVGLRHLGYIGAATLSAALIWGVVFFLNERKRRAGLIAGIFIGLAIQQTAYQAWKAELPGFWWPLAQFGAVQVAVAYGIGRTTS